jgi:hypothetical protein
MIRMLVAALVLVCAASIADARPRQLAAGCNQLWPCEVPAAQRNDFLYGVRSIDVEMTKRPVYRPERHRVRSGIEAVSAGAVAQVIGGRPPGCPARFCGCGASLHLFGRIIPSLNLAANWLRFPRAAPAPKMAAARRGHVFVLESHISGDTWLVYDANSGGRRTRLHARSIAGFAIVDPGGAA